MQTRGLLGVLYCIIFLSNMHKLIVKENIIFFRNHYIRIFEIPLSPRERQKKWNAQEVRQHPDNYIFPYGADQIIRKSRTNITIV